MRHDSFENPRTGGEWKRFPATTCRPIDGGSVHARHVPDDTLFPARADDQARNSGEIKGISRRSWRMATPTGRIGIVVMIWTRCRQTESSGRHQSAESGRSSNTPDDSLTTTWAYERNVFSELFIKSCVTSSFPEIKFRRFCRWKEATF